MKKSKIVPALVLASTFLLSACGQEPCAHVDENHDQICDKCGEDVVTAHTFDQTSVKNENTLKEAANCEHGNIYYKTCECGAIATSETDIGPNTFKDATIGSVSLGHVYGELPLPFVTSFYSNGFISEEKLNLVSLMFFQILIQRSDTLTESVNFLLSFVKEMLQIFHCCISSSQTDLITFCLDESS